MADQVSITINGVQFQATKGSLLIDKLLDEKSISLTFVIIKRWEKMEIVECVWLK